LVTIHSEKTNILLIIQARMSSNRLPGKVLKLINGIPLVMFVYKRCSSVFKHRTIIATSESSSDDDLYEFCLKNDMWVERGNLENVLFRFIKIGEKFKAKYIIRVCADTPFVDIYLAVEMLNILINEELDYVAPNKKGCASCFFSEVVRLDALKKVMEEADNPLYLEHVTKYIVDNPSKFSLKFLEVNLMPDFIRGVRLTIDYPEDLVLAEDVLSKIPKDKKITFYSEDVLTAVKQVLFDRSNI